MKTKQTIIITATLIAISAIVIAVLVLRTHNTAAVSTTETAVEKKVVKKKPVKKTSALACTKPTETFSAKVVKPPRTEVTGTAVGENVIETPKVDGVDAEREGLVADS